MENALNVKAVWADEHLLEIRCVLRTSEWAGLATAYTTPQDLARFSEALAGFLRHCDGSVAFEAGADTGIGLIGFRVYPINRARHIGCHLRLVGPARSGHRPEEIARLELELRIEPSGLEKFARGLRNLAATQEGEARLDLLSAA